jgi:hypothetical protein
MEFWKGELRGADSLSGLCVQAICPPWANNKCYGMMCRRVLGEIRNMCKTADLVSGRKIVPLKQTKILAMNNYISL